MSGPWDDWHVTGTRQAWVGPSYVLAGTAGGFGAWLMLTTRPLTFAIALAAVAFVLVTLTRPNWLVPITVFLAFAAAPSWVPQAVGLGGISIFIFEPTLFAAALWLASRRQRRVPKPLWGFLLAATMMTGLGLWRDWNVAWFLADARPILDLIVGAYVAYRYLAMFGYHAIVRAAGVTVWFSALLTAFSSLTGYPLSGRSEIASLTGAQEGAERLLTAAVFPSLALVCIVVALLITTRSTAGPAVFFLAPALLILLLAFSRNHVLGIAVAALAATLATPSVATKMRGVTRLLTVGLTVSVAVAGLSLSGASPWLTSQLDSFSTRVLGGLSSDTRAVDASTQYRLSENRDALPMIKQSPVFGHGFGAEYKAPSGPAGSFFATRATSYIHNGYLWLLLKGGLVALLAFLALLLKPVLALMRGQRRPELVAVASTLLGLASVTAFAPLMIGFPTAVLFGFVIGAGFHYSNRPDTSTGQGLVPNASLASTSTHDRVQQGLGQP